MKAKTCAIYTRISTDMQKNDSQLFDLRRYAEQRGFEVYEEYCDIVSGSKDSRPALNRMMDAAKKRKFDAVMVWKFDRYARSTRHLLSALEEFRSAGVDFISYQENIDTGTPMGIAMFTILSALGQLELDVTRSRVTAGLRAAKARGKKLGRPRVADSAAIMSLREKGMSAKDIAKSLGVSKSTVHAVLSSLQQTPKKVSE